MSLTEYNSIQETLHLVSITSNRKRLNQALDGYIKSCFFGSNASEFNKEKRVTKRNLFFFKTISLEQKKEVGAQLRASFYYFSTGSFGLYLCR